MPKHDTPLATALARAMDAHGLTVTDLARDVDIDPETLRAVTDGRTVRPGRHIRDALDAYLAPGLPAGTTLAIVNGHMVDYPHDSTLELVAIIQEMEPDTRAHLTALLRALHGP